MRPSYTKKRLVWTGIFFFLVLSLCAAGGNIQRSKTSVPQTAPAALWPETVDNPNPLPDPDPPVPAAAPREDDTRRAGEVMKALSAAYPDRLGAAEYRDGDWAVPVRHIRSGGAAAPAETWFYYAGGRLLPEELRDKAGNYDPQPFYNYPAELPPWRDPDAEEEARLRAVSQRRRTNPPRRSQHFFDALWRAGSRNESWDRVKSIRFLGRPVMVHYMILEELSLVEERILSEAKTNPRIQQWIGSLNTLDGWNWRDIADTRSRSFHAYGAALDLLPKSLGGRETYWLWAARRTPEWWTVSYDKRIHPPEAVIRAFEAQGFIWGGKWLFFDTMHFEYRPEILILNNLPVSGE
ncbi:MAG: M15 family metallopeptidase [Treponema sp.]|nr:M15 family metallopeptidase [Treponema sp.]